MKRNVSLDEISDGRLYDVNDMVRADTNGCGGCSACCRGVGHSIVLDPLDMFRLTTNLGVRFEQLMGEQRIELHVEEGVILPNLKMQGTQESCTFLGVDGRCTIHAWRPGICRLFPLGRYYVEDAYKFILQIHECSKPGKSKVKVRKWIDTPDYEKNKEFVLAWHRYLKNLQTLLADSEDEKAREMNMQMLKTFYLQPYDGEADFYDQFRERLMGQNS